MKNEKLHPILSPLSDGVFFFLAPHFSEHRFTDGFLLSLGMRE